MMAEVFEFSPLRVDGRDQLVRDAGVDHGYEAMVVTSLTNIRWLTGFTGSNATAVVGPQETVLVTDARYTTQAAEELESCGSTATVMIASDLVDAATEVVSADWAIALEDSVPWSVQRLWDAAVAGELVACHELVEEMRAVKSAPEIERMQAAAAIVDDALADAARLLSVGTTERTLALAIDDGMRARGASGPAYETIVASGPNAARPHARPTDRAFSEGDPVIVDAGALVDGYRSDMTRTFFVGEPSQQTRDMHDVVTRSQAAGVSGVGPDVEAGTVDALCRDIIEDAEMGDAFLHGTGHGVGLDIHELPRIRRGSTAILRSGHVITVEPGVYLPEVGGVRVEDTVVVTEDGCRALTRYPKSPIPD